MRLPKPLPPPTLDFGGISEATKSQKDLDHHREDELWQRQQNMLADNRSDLVFTVDSYKSGKRTSNEVREIIERVANKVHVAGWEDIVAVTDALAKLGDEFHSGIYMLGGWHHVGDLTRLAKPSQNLLDQLRDYRVLLWADELRDRVVKADPESKGVAQAKLVAFLQQWPRLFSTGSWDKIDELEAVIWHNQRILTLSVETQLLFLQNRVFAFTPAAASATAGWKDFSAFVKAYRKLRRRFKNEFQPYYWAVFLPKR